MSILPSPRVVGLEPWLPWPLKASDWWTQPVRAERLAVLRVGVAACLLIDILTSYLPHLQDFFGTAGLGGTEMFAYYGEAPKLNWSLLRGFGDPLLGAFALVTWIALTAWLVLDFWAGRRSRRVVQKAPESSSVTATEEQSTSMTWLVVSWFVSGIFVILGVWSRQEPALPMLHSWQDEPFLLTAALGAWVAATVLLLAGLWTRWAALATWVLSMSFANVNPNIDNAGDTIRGIILFYLMLCPCGAAWSVDAWRRRQREVGPAFVWPWVLRLLFVQLVFIYFMNGLYKLAGSGWLEGNSLYYVLGDLSLTRVSAEQVAIPLVLTQIATWLVLAWEVTFPVLVLFRRTRNLALWFGVAFHVGIFASMELGGFVPYILCLYLPLVPWEKMRRVSDA